MLLGKLEGGKTKRTTNPWGRDGSEIEPEEEQDTWENHTLQRDTMPA